MPPHKLYQSLRRNHCIGTSINHAFIHPSIFLVASTFKSLDADAHVHIHIR